MAKIPTARGTREAFISTSPTHREKHIFFFLSGLSADAGEVDVWTQMQTPT